MRWFVIGAGLFTVIAALADWEWFMNHHKARFFVRIFGRNGTRVFYILLGTGLVVLGALAATGRINWEENLF